MENQEFIYDEEAAVVFIQNHLPIDLKERFTEDCIYYLLDTICDFYEKNDYLNETDEEKEEKDLIKYLTSQAKKDEIGEYTSEEMLLFLKAEEAYTDTLDID
ncbi:hypothetical protein LJB98_03890 [Bacteroidales bacterium OttesenSCG-928-M11]|nr:hypothetical protein [Bacteroidales bacterium OttesenSCG-928-M11]